MSQVPASRSRPRPAARAIVRVQSAEERDLERCLRAIEARTRQAAGLRAELTALRGALLRFEAACQARVGDLLAELRRVGRAAADYGRRLEKLREEPEPDAALTADEPTDEDEDPGAFAWSDGGRAAEDAWASGPEPADPAAASPRSRGANEAAVKRLYIDLAKRCHPDYAGGDEERRRREALMQRVNEAFRARDLAALRALAREAEAADPGFAERPVRERLAWALAELARLDEVVAELRGEIALLRAGEVHRLWRRYEAGEAVLDALEDDLQLRLAAEGRRLDRLIAAYRAARDERREAAAV